MVLNLVRVKAEMSRTLRWMVVVLSSGTMAVVASALSYAQAPVTPPKVTGGPPGKSIPKKAPPNAPATGPNLTVAVANPTSRLPVASIASVEGSVLVSTPTGLVAAKPGTPLQNGFRIITAGKSDALIQFSDGCSVLLSALQRFQVNAALTCAERIQSVSSLVLDPAALQAALGGGTQSVALGAAGGGLVGPLGIGGGLVGASAAAAGRPQGPQGPDSGPVSPN